ncbi:DNA-processing protein DprA [Spiroplasma diminutum]|uniref:DNA processing/uptake protein n=1 Tax=Spiroplasma diminutum CUAS-1 TaxID=1276221 RepID=S5M1N6_9MOLU|nr:DNA-processing protein DprA [Spiroplasma diminutum]AGR41977.1 DNA processing/uptake protein [Spiroplasma diminutum CUAS-1]
MENVLLYFSIKYKGNWDKIYHALDIKEKITHKDLEEISNKINCKFITILNPLYPNYLKNTHKPPFVIFYKGDITLLSKYHKTIAFIGGEEVNEYGIKNIDSLMSDLNEEKIIFSTIQNIGVNTEVLDNANNNGYKIVKILNQSMKDYLKKTIELPERENLLAISEIYENDTINFENNDYSNRLLCGISKAIVFVQFKGNDPVNKLFTFSVNEGKDIFAIPDTTFSKSGTNKLIKNGAKLIEFAKDILNEI